MGESRRVEAPKMWIQADPPLSSPKWHPSYTSKSCMSTRYGCPVLLKLSQNLAVLVLINPKVKARLPRRLAMDFEIRGEGPKTGESQ